MGKLAMGELEGAAMDVLWDRGGWLTPGEVHEVLGADRDRAYTTVMTILVRLWQNGRLERQRDGRAYAYRPVASRGRRPRRVGRQRADGAGDGRSLPSRVSGARRTGHAG
ncbi:MAG: BlaI/MecI/CopY family transcriptional regulator [Acidimicrobiales bacterium]